MFNDAPEITEASTELSPENHNCYGQISEVLSCNFDNDIRCGWKSKNFRLWHQSTFTPETGPDFAHSGDHYLYLESSEDKSAKLESVVLPGGMSVCVRFSLGIINIEK
jgi:hypothetical protein